MTSFAHVQQRAAGAVLWLVALLFCAPVLVPVHLYPLTTFHSEWIAACTLAAAMIVSALAKPVGAAVGWPLPAIVGLLLGVGLIHGQLGMLHYTYTLTSLLLFLCALLSAYLLGRWIVASELRAPAMKAVATGLVIGGLLQVAVQLVQVLDVRGLPSWLVFPIIEKMSARRPFGNLAQPNQLATYLVWATIAAGYLARTSAPRVLLAIAGAIFFCGVALTGSRMGSLFCLLLVVFVLAGTTLGPAQPRTRLWVSLTLAAGYAIGLLLTRMLLVDDSGAMATALERYAEGSFGQRLSMWRDALRITVASPWIGVGVGEYGGAQYWFAHADPSLLATNNPHNLVLHIAAEFGLPVAAAVIVIAWLWVRRHAHLWGSDRDGSVALALLLFLLAHSMLEYPLWHLHFLIPLGLLIGLAERVAVAPVARQIRARAVLVPIGLVALLGAAVMKSDYDTVVPVWNSFLTERFDARPHGPETISGVLTLRDQTYFRPQIDRLYVDLRPVDAMRGDEDIDVSARVLTRLADVHLIERHIELLLQAGRIDETYRHIARLKIFAGADYPLVRSRIEEAIAGNGAILDPVRRALAAP